MDALILSRIQFAANITFHILFPAITIALGWFLLFFKLRYNATKNYKWMRQILIKLPLKNDQYCWLPFAQTAIIAVLCFIGLGYSFFPFIIPDQMLIVQASSANESLIIILVGVAIVLPILLLYTFFSYKIFHGKAEEDLRYD
jgi:cytochrome bd-type quinol oxidase subunit 2